MEGAQIRLFGGRHHILQHFQNVENLNQVRVPANAIRENVHVLTKEEKPDMLHLDAHHSPCTEWNSSHSIH